MPFRRARFRRYFRIDDRRSRYHYASPASMIFDCSKYADVMIFDYHGAPVDDYSLYTPGTPPRAFDASATDVTLD